MKQRIFEKVLDFFVKICENIYCIGMGAIIPRLNKKIKGTCADGAVFQFQRGLFRADRK